MSIVGKVFISVLNTRIKRWMESNKVIAEGSGKGMQQWTKYLCCGKSCKGKRGGRNVLPGVPGYKRAYDVVERDCGPTMDKVVSEERCGAGVQED